MNLAILGPTACGKTRFAVELAQLLSKNTVAISVDSVQVYRGIEIGTAKPSQDERKLLPHLLIDIAELGSQYTAADYRRDVIACQKTLPKDQIVFFVGGTGFYFQALEKGMLSLNEEVPAELKANLQARMQAEGLPALYAELCELDPESAAKIKPQDSYRVLRALEIILSQGEKLSSLKNQHDPKSESIFKNQKLHKLGLFVDRTELRPIVERRAQQMLASGWIDEVENLRAKGLADWAPMKSVGYKEINAVLDGELESGQLLEQIVTSTMQLAKRQMTWFRRDPEIQWFDSVKDMQKAITESVKQLQQ